MKAKYVITGESDKIRYTASEHYYEISEQISYVLHVHFGEHRLDEEIFHEDYNVWKPSVNIPSFRKWVEDMLANFAIPTPRIPLKHENVKLR